MSSLGRPVVVRATISWSLMETNEELGALGPWLHAYVYAVLSRVLLPWGTKSSRDAHELYMIIWHLLCTVAGTLQYPPRAAVIAGHLRQVAVVQKDSKLTNSMQGQQHKCWSYALQCVRPAVSITCMHVQLVTCLHLSIGTS